MGGVGQLPPSSLSDSQKVLALFLRHCGAASMHRRWMVFLGHLSGSSESRRSEVAALADLCFVSGSQKVLAFCPPSLCRLDTPSGPSHDLFFFFERDAPLGGDQNEKP